MLENKIEKVKRVATALLEFKNNVTEEALNQKLLMPSDELKKILIILEREGIAFRPKLGYWRHKKRL